MSTATATKVFADRIGRIEVSATMAITAAALKLKSEGIDLADFGAGEPHFATPRHIKDAAIEAIEKNFTRYTAVAGTPEVRQAIVDRHAADFGSELHARGVRVHDRRQAGAVQRDPGAGGPRRRGDSAGAVLGLVQGHHPVRGRRGGVRSRAEEEENFRITAQMIEAAITPKTKAIILNTPSNPSGAVVSPADLEAIVRLAHKRGIFVLLDECYVYLNYTGQIVSGGSFTDCKEHVIVLGSLSKTYAMTGWRAGFALGPKAIIAAMSKLQSQSTSNTASMVQRASIAAVHGSQECVAEMRADYIKLRDRVLEGLQDDSRTDLHGAGGRVLCVSECEAIYRQGRDQVGDGSGGEAAERGACGGGSGRGVWNDGAHSAVVCGVARCDRRRREADAGVLREAELGGSRP